MIQSNPSEQHVCLNDLHSLCNQRCMWCKTSSSKIYHLSTTPWANAASCYWDIELFYNSQSPSHIHHRKHTPFGWPVPFSQSDKQTLCKICFSLACSHTHTRTRTRTRTHTHTQIRLLLNASSRVSHSGARGRRQAKQSSVWWLLPQIVTTKHPEYWAAMLLIWRQRFIQFQHNGENGPLCPQFVSSAFVWTQIIFICQCLCWGSAVERVDVQALISNTCLYQLLTCPLTTSNWK